MSSTIRSYLHTLRIAIRELRRHKLEPETFFMDDFLKEDSVCLHIGASDGRHSFYMARLAPKGRVYCIEPSPYTLRVVDRLKNCLVIKTFTPGTSGCPILLARPIW